MPSPVIQVENLSKYYRLGLIGGGTLNEDINRWVAKVRGKPDPLLIFGEKDHGNRKDGQIWALKDVSLEVNEGEILGIIGRNGAGKSTLLKILSKITAPTEGRIKIKGRVGSLLEVGTGFHPELTGRENIYLNGTILGMSRAEVTSKLEEIIEFAEMGKFIDTPVKRYSSGMRVRLAFAVAAHLEPEILIIDEILAVGDVAFQNKCLGKIQDVAGHGRTVLFVSHNMGIINKLCPSTVWLSGGTVRRHGETREVVSEYVATSVSNIDSSSTDMEMDQSKPSQLASIRLLNQKGEARDVFDCDHPITLKLKYIVRKKVVGLYGYLQIMKMDQTAVLVSDSFDSGSNTMDDLSLGEHAISITIPARTLAAGSYCIYLNFTRAESQGETIDSPGIVSRFHLHDMKSKRGDKRGGYFSLLLEWNVGN
jgi:lipopolysaccharide transport system ATP-binding protein